MASSPPLQSTLHHLTVAHETGKEEEGGGGGGIDAEVPAVPSFAQVCCAFLASLVLSMSQCVGSFQWKIANS